MAFEQLWAGDGSRAFASLPSRMALGSTMIYHGAGKLGRGHLAESAEGFEKMGIKPGKPWALATGLSELLAGLLAISGVGTRLAALAVLVTQGVAVAKVHRQHGFSNMKGGYEFNLALMAIAAGLLLAGPGGVSLHAALERRVQRRQPRGLRRLRRRARPRPTLRAVELIQ